MRFLLEHQSGCTPLFPCTSCRTMSLLHGKLEPEQVEELSDLIASVFESKEEDRSIPHFLLKKPEFSIEETFSPRVANLLKRNNITIESLYSMTRKELMLLPRFGVSAVDEIENFIVGMGGELMP